ncbi:MAG: hypothetical protein HYT71_04210 [Candidatus Aenigmarchaeota archaeon]|nr:hypothetical protein [Candidatus Aenigmarchaeota archaeon]
MGIVETINIARMRGANVRVAGNMLGPYDITAGSLPKALTELYSLLEDVGCTYNGKGLNYRQNVVDDLRHGLGVIATDDPVSVVLAPRMGGHKFEYHEKWRLAGWRLPDLGLGDELVLADVGDIDGIQIYLTGVEGKRFKTVEAVVRMALHKVYQ